MSRTTRREPYNPDRIKGCKTRTRAALKHDLFALINEEMN